MHYIAVKAISGPGIESLFANVDGSNRFLLRRHGWAPGDPDPVPELMLASAVAKHGWLPVEPPYFISVNDLSELEQAVPAIMQRALAQPEPEPNRAERIQPMLERRARHEQVYRTPGLPALECSLVDDQIIAGRNPLTAWDADWLAAVGVTHVLDLREAWEWAPPRFGAEAVEAVTCTRLHLPVRDMQAPTSADLDAADRFFTEALEDPGALVYVHCRAGRERTAAVLCAYFGRRYGLSYEQALARLRQRRPLSQPLREQERAVRAWL